MSRLSKSGSITGYISYLSLFWLLSSVILKSFHVSFPKKVSSNLCDGVSVSCIRLVKHIAVQNVYVSLLCQWPLIFYLLFCRYDFSSLDVFLKPRKSKLLTHSICVSFILRSSVGIFFNGWRKTIHLDFSTVNESLLAFNDWLIFTS